MRYGSDGGGHPPIVHAEGVARPIVALCYTPRLCSGQHRPPCQACPPRGRLVPPGTTRSPQGALIAQRVRRRLPPLLLGLFTLAALRHAPVAAQALPRLSIAPLAGPCGPGDPPLTVRGVDFPPGQAIAVLSRRAGYTERVPKLLVGRATVAADGAFVIRERPSDCDPSAADGTRYQKAATPRNPRLLPDAAS